VSENSKYLYVVDYKSINGGSVAISNIHPDVDHVYIDNGNEVPVYFDGFPDNAFMITPGNHCKQCECIIFPQSCDPTDWILAIEMKYAYSIEIAFRENIDYPNCMIDQIISTVNYLRENGVIEKGRRVSAIVSFPRLIEDFSASFFSGTRSMEDIIVNDNIRIRATNRARIRSSRNINI